MSWVLASKLGSDIAAVERQPAAFRGSPIHTTRSSLTSVARTETCWTIILVDNMRIGGRLDITWMAS